MPEIVEFEDSRGQPGAVVYGRKTNCRVRRAPATSTGDASSEGAAPFLVKEIGGVVLTAQGYEKALHLACQRAG